MGDQVSTTLPQGYEVFTRALDETYLAGLRDAITETIDRTARALRTPFEASAPDLPPEQRLEQVAQRDHAYASALFHAVMADTHRDARVANLAGHPRLGDIVRHLVAPKIVTGHVVRPRAVIPAFTTARSPWHQDVLRPSMTAGSL
jgi:hypothetical protein